MKNKEIVYGGLVKCVKGFNKGRKGTITHILRHSFPFTIVDDVQIIEENTNNTTFWERANNLKEVKDGSILYNSNENRRANKTRGIR